MRFKTFIVAALASSLGCGESAAPGEAPGTAIAGAPSPAPAPAPASNMPAQPAQAEGSAMIPAKPMPAADGGPNDWRPLLEGAWELPPGAEGYRCVRLTLTEDVYIKEFQPIAPLGTHHTLLSVNETPTGPDGVSVCSASDNGHVTLLGSGVGTNYSAGPLPDGVAFKVAKGSQLNLTQNRSRCSTARTISKTSGRRRLDRSS